MRSHALPLPIAALLLLSACAAGALPEGMTVQTLRSGAGASPGPLDEVRVNYTGKLMDGTIVDSTDSRGPATFPLMAVIPCWTLGLQRMQVGETALLTCPPATAYGKRGAEAIPGNATLQFEVELLEIVPPAER